MTTPIGFGARLAASRARLGTVATEPINRTYKRDKDGRFSSGGGSGGGARGSLAAAVTTDEVAAVTAHALEQTLGHPVLVDLRGMDVQLAREHMEGILQGAERFPNVRLGSVSTYGPGASSPTHGGDPLGESHAVTSLGPYSKNYDDIAFNVSRSAEAYRRGLVAAGVSKWQSVATPTGVALHEFGHVLAGHGSAAGHAETLAQQAARAVDQGTSRFVRDHVSVYAASDPHELTAEAFADVMAHGQNASDLSRDIFARIEIDYSFDRGGAGPSNRTYKRDGDGKFSSGGGAGSGGVRAELAATRTAEEAAAVVSRQASAIAGEHVRVDFRGADPAVARQFGEGILRGLEAYPATPLREVSTYGPGGGDGYNAQLANTHSMGAAAIAARDGDGLGYQVGQARLPNGATVVASMIMLNVGVQPQGWRDLSTLHEVVASRGLQRPAVVGDPIGVAMHEFGHVVASYGSPQIPESAVVDRIRSAAERGGLTMEAASRTVSTYAATNGSELTAEVFADVMMNGDKAADTSKHLFQTLDTHARGWEKQVSGAGRTSNYGARAARIRTLVPPEAAARTYRRDRDGKFSSGGGGGGVRQTLAAAGTAEQVSRAAEAEAQRITGRSVRFKLTGSDPQIAREHAEGVLQGLERYPGAQLHAVHAADLGEGSEAVMARTYPDAGVISFNSRAQAKGADDLRESMRFAHEVGSLTVGDPIGTAYHEFAHIAEHTYQPSAGVVAQRALAALKASGEWGAR